MSFAERIGIGATAEQKAIAAFCAHGWCVIGHGLAQVGRLQLPIITQAGEKPSTDFIALKAGDFRMIECKSKEPLGRGGFGLDADQWETLLAHDRLLPGKTMLLIEDRQQDELLVAQVSRLKLVASWSLNRRYVLFLREHFGQLDDFFMENGEWLT
ncbi:MAG: hypothetical protein LW713_09435 [Acetobacteraceae bacterium]|jgi:Holliday junction resolvase|nr:hypothetical protein [Acetobacteraceae bacterium]